MFRYILFRNVLTRLSFCLIFLCFGLNCTAFANKFKHNYQLYSPKRTVLHFIKYTNPDNYNPAIAALSFADYDKQPSKYKLLASKLRKVIDGKGIIIRTDKIPDDSNFVDSATNISRFRISNQLDGIYIEKINNQWLFSDDAIEAISSIYKDVFPIEIQAINSIIPAFAKNSILGIQIWKFFALVILIGISIILYFFLIWLFGSFIVMIAHRFSYESIANRFIKPIAKPISMLIVAILFLEVIPIIEFAVIINTLCNYLLRAVIPIFSLLIIFKLIDLIAAIFGKIAERTETTVDDNIIPLIRKGIKVIVFVFVIIYTLKAFDIDVTPIIAGVSIGGLALALAAQDTVKNIFGSVTIFTDQPFQVGDRIVFDNIDGIVEEIGIRSTRIRTLYNSLVTIPNGKLADLTIDNMGQRSKRRFSTNFGINFNTPVELIDCFVLGLRNIVANQNLIEQESIEIHLNSFGDSAINILFHTFIITDDWTVELNVRHNILIEIINLAKELGISFAYPTSTILVEEFPEKQAIKPDYLTKNINFLDKLNNYFNNKTNKR